GQGRHRRRVRAAVAGGLQLEGAELGHADRGRGAVHRRGRWHPRGPRAPRVGARRRCRREGEQRLQPRVGHRARPLRRRLSSRTEEEDPMKLYATPPSPRAFKVVAVAHHLGLEPEMVFVDLLNGDHMKPEFAALNPNRKMPVLEDDGFVLWESNAIMQYLASKKPASGLWPTDPRHQADVSRWQCWDLAHWERACGTLVY